MAAALLACQHCGNRCTLHITGCQVVIMRGFPHAKSAGCCCYSCSFWPLAEQQEQHRQQREPVRYISRTPLAFCDLGLLKQLHNSCCSSSTGIAIYGSGAQLCNLLQSCRTHSLMVGPEPVHKQTTLRWYQHMGQKQHH